MNPAIKFLVIFSIGAAILLGDPVGRVYIHSQFENVAEVKNSGLYWLVSYEDNGGCLWPVNFKVLVNKLTGKQKTVESHIVTTSGAWP